MTTIEWLIEQCPRIETIVAHHILEEAKQMDEKNIKDAIMYALDEDGHTGDWKLKFANNYYEKLKK